MVPSPPNAWWKIRRFLVYCFWSWNISRNRNRKRNYFLPPPSLSLLLSVHLFTSIKRGQGWPQGALSFFPFLSPSHPSSRHLRPSVSLWLTSEKESASYQLYWLMVSDLDFMWAGRISALVLSELAFICTEVPEQVTHLLVFHLRLDAFSSNFYNNRRKRSRMTVIVMVMGLLLQGRRDEDAMESWAGLRCWWGY